MILMILENCPSFPLRTKLHPRNKHFVEKHNNYMRLSQNIAQRCILWESLQFKVFGCSFAKFLGRLNHYLQNGTRSL